MAVATETADRPAAAPAADPSRMLGQRMRWRTIETVLWLAALLPFVLAPTHLQLASQIAITALFAISLDLILGYAGIVSLGHAAFFGLGAYASGLLARAGFSDPLLGLAAAALLAAALGFVTSFLVLRGADPFIVPLGLMNVDVDFRKLVVDQDMR